MSLPGRACANVRRQEELGVSEELRKQLVLKCTGGMAGGEGARVGTKEFTFYYGK